MGSFRYLFNEKIALLCRQILSKKPSSIFAHDFFDNLMAYLTV